MSATPLSFLNALLHADLDDLQTTGGMLRLSMVSVSREAISRLCDAVPGVHGAIKKRKVTISMIFLFYVALTMAKWYKSGHCIPGLFKFFFYLWSLFV